MRRLALERQLQSHEHRDYLLNDIFSGGVAVTSG